MNRGTCSDCGEDFRTMEVNKEGPNKGRKFFTCKQGCSGVRKPVLNDEGQKRKAFWVDEWESGAVETGTKRSSSVETPSAKRSELDVPASYVVPPRHIDENAKLILSLHEQVVELKRMVVELLAIQKIKTPADPIAISFHPLSANFQ